MTDEPWGERGAYQLAAQAMLAALKAFVAKIDPAILVENDLSMSPLADELRAAFDAIAQAEAAGMTTGEDDNG